MIGWMPLTPLITGQSRLYRTFRPYGVNEGVHYTPPDETAVLEPEIRRNGGCAFDSS